MCLDIDALQRKLLCCYIIKNTKSTTPGPSTVILEWKFILKRSSTNACRTHCMNSFVKLIGAYHGSLLYNMVRCRCLCYILSLADFSEYLTNPPKIRVFSSTFVLLYHELLRSSTSSLVTFHLLYWCRLPTSNSWPEATLTMLLHSIYNLSLWESLMYWVLQQKSHFRSSQDQGRWPSRSCVSSSCWCSSPRDPRCRFLVCLLI